MPDPSVSDMLKELREWLDELENAEQIRACSHEPMATTGMMTPKLSAFIAMLRAVLDRAEKLLANRGPGALSMIAKGDAIRRHEDAIIEAERDQVIDVALHFIHVPNQEEHLQHVDVEGLQAGIGTRLVDGPLDRGVEEALDGGVKAVGRNENADLHGRDLLAR